MPSRRRRATLAPSVFGRRTGGSTAAVPHRAGAVRAATRRRMTLWELNRLSAPAFATALGRCLRALAVGGRACAARSGPSRASMRCTRRWSPAMRSAPATSQIALDSRAPGARGQGRAARRAHGRLDAGAIGRGPCPMLGRRACAPDGAQRRLQREVRLPVHPCGQGLRSRGHPARVRAARRTRP